MEYGNKANTLIELKKDGFNIPDFVATDKMFFNDFLKNSGVYEDAQMVLVKSAWLKEIFKNIKSKINLYNVDKYIENKLIELTKDLKFPVSVRSSCSVEDGQLNSCAGLYYTKLNVEKNELAAEVKNVIASLYNENSLMVLSNQTYHPDDYYMGVIIQEMVVPNISGVAFTSDPVNNDNSKIIIEVVEGYCDQLVSGYSKSKLYVLEKYDDSDITNINGLNNLKKVLMQLENYYKYPVDVEWAILDEKIYILQCRPVIIRKSKINLNNYKTFSISELNHNTYELLGDLKPRYKKWLKKAKFYKFCQENNIRNPEWKLLSFSDYTNLNFEQILCNYKSPYVIYHLNNKYLDICRKEDLVDILRKYSESKNNKLLCVSIRECIPNDVASISQMHEDGTIHIECVSGKMSLLNNGVVTPTRYITNLDGDIIDVSIKNQNIYQFDDQVLEFINTNKRKKIELNKSIIRTISNKTQLLYKEFGNCSIEWWIWKDEIYAADISILSKDVDSKGGMVISSGLVSGTLRKLPVKDKNIMNDLNMFSAVSVSDTEFDINKVDALRDFSYTINEWKKEDKVILYSEMPYIYLSPFVNEIDGFIFDDASLLCHLSLIIREAHKPAISLLGKKLSDCLNKKIVLNGEEGTVIIKEV